MFWGIAHGTLEFRGCFFGDFFGFVRVSMTLEGSDSDFDTVLMRFPNVFAIFIIFQDF